MTAFAEFIFGIAPVAVAKSLAVHPGQWSVDYPKGRHYTLQHLNGTRVWIANSTYGMHIEAGDYRWGGVTYLSTLYLSPGHHLLRQAANRWLRDHAPGRMTARQVAAALS